MGERGSNSIPNRWLRCPRKSLCLIEDKFIVFKTPLSDRYNDQVPVDCRFPPKMFFKFCKEKKIQIGLWIDLTNTNRFYDKNDIEKEGCKYLKLPCRGHGETPSKDQTNLFVNVCRNFISQNPLKVIAVHCTHGFNRSGFMIVSYLIESIDCSIEIAIQLFSRCRPPGIYKQEYLDELYNRFADIDETIPAPQLPEWCNEEENAFDRDDQNFTNPSVAVSENGQSSNSGSDGSQTYPKRPRGLKKTPVFMEGVSGVTLFTEYPKYCHLQRKIQKMCGMRSKNDFPGCQPVSMDLMNITLLKVKPYRVSWKADGTRYMMLIDGEDEVYFFDRDNCVFKVQCIRFLIRTDLNRHLANTLVDGEMVIDKVDGENIPRFLVYDIISFEGKDVKSMPFYPTRIQYIQHEIIGPRYNAIVKGIINKAAEPFSIRMKDFWDVTQAHSLLGEKFAKNLSHEPDGLIFQPSKDPYVPGRCDEVLKWKPADLNSIDFRLKIVIEDAVGLIPTKVGQLFVGQLRLPFAKMKWTKAIKDLTNKIVECKFENGEWIFMRERTDKSFPNSLNTANAVCETIRNPITKEKLLGYIEAHRFVDDSEAMPPPAKMARR